MKLLLSVLVLFLVFISIDAKHVHVRPVRFGTTRKFIEHTEPLVSMLKEGWVGKRIIDISNTEVELTIGIRQRNIDQLEQIVNEVSDVTHKNYGKYLGFQQIKEMVQPAQESIDIVKSWLDQNKITGMKLTGGGDFIRGMVGIAKAEHLLNVTYQRFTNDNTGVHLIRSIDPYSVPSEVAKHIDFIGGVNHFPGSLNFAQSNDVSLITPWLLRGVMNVTATSAHPKNTQAIAQFLEQYFSKSDFEIFHKSYPQFGSAETPVFGPNSESDPGVETALDIQYITAMAPNVSTWIISTGGQHEGQEPFLNWLVDLSSDPNLPYVHSISYGDDEASIETSYINRVDNEFKKYAAMGRTLVFSSGDSGVGCQRDCKAHVPGWPASSRYVLSVGGVFLENHQVIGDSISGGGFSNNFPRPDYQADVVEDYLKSVSQETKMLFNESGRGYPDIASFSEGIIIVHNRRFTVIGGTSASAPIIAGLLSSINNQRLSLGQPTIGFVNPLLYKVAKDNPESFFDIKTGSNEFRCCDGFKASAGWDPITGLGMPNFNVLLDHMTTNLKTN